MTGFIGKHGGADRLTTDFDERGFSHIEGRLCLDHLNDYYLRDRIRPQDSTSACEFCERTDRVRGRIEDLASMVVDALRYWYSDPVSELAWDGAEGGYQGPVVDESEAIGELCTGAFEDPVATAITETLSAATRMQSWTPWGAGADLDPPQFAWGVYADDVRRESRFVFPVEPYPDRLDAPYRVARHCGATYLSPTSIVLVVPSSRRTAI